jgi:predicted nucleic-acid-binding protein
MRAVDTNVLVRLHRSRRRSPIRPPRSFHRNHGMGSGSALVEAAWVLRKVYKLSHRKLVATIETLLGHQN